jgi:hypothetical protein
MTLAWGAEELAPPKKDDASSEKIGKLLTRNDFMIWNLLINIFALENISVRIFDNPSHLSTLTSSTSSPKQL